MHIHYYYYYSTIYILIVISLNNRHVHNSPYWAMFAIACCLPYRLNSPQRGDNKQRENSSKTLPKRAEHRKK